MFGHWNLPIGLFTFAAIWAIIHWVGNHFDERASMSAGERAPMEMIEAIGASSVIAFFGCLIYAAFHIRVLR